MQDFLSETQINAFIRKWERVPYNQWDDEDIELALTFRSISKRFYNLLRTKKKLPLPADATLKKHFKHFKVTEGYLESVDPLLRIKATWDLSAEQRLVTLNFDEVHLKADISYNRETDQIIGWYFNASLYNLWLGNCSCSYHTVLPPAGN